MKLIYLDTSNLALLTKTKNCSPKQFKSFIKQWKENNFILAISEAHVFEIIRHGSDIEIESRFDLINHFLPIRFEKMLFPKEIVFALKKKSLFNFAVTDFTVHKFIFGEIICSQNQLLTLKKFAKGFYSNISKNSHEISKNLWQPNRFVPQKEKDKKFRIEDLPTSFPLEFKVYLQKVLKLSKPYSIQNPDAWNQLNNFVIRADKIGFQQAFIEMVGKEANNQSILKKPIYEFQQEMIFRNSLNYFLSQLLYADKRTINITTEKISITDCPGQWLRYKVENQIRVSGDSEVSNEMDLKHISHLPYVDILIADKRVVENTTQILRKGNLPKTSKPIPSPIKVSNNLLSLETALYE